MSSEPPVSGKRHKGPEVPGELRSRGLPSVAQARAERRRTHWLPPRFWLWAITCIGAGIIVWWKVEQGEVNEMRAELLAKQRAVKAELGPRWFPLRDKIEQWVQHCGAEPLETKPPPEELAESWDFRKMPGIYLRLSQADTKSPEAIRDAASKSLRDGFTSCLLTVDNPSPIAGAECFTTEDCPPGRYCNEFKHCAAPSQPYNLRTAFHTMQVMSDDWVAEIQEISNKLTMRGAVATFKSTSEYDLPVAADLLQRSKYFLVVVDEPAEVDETQVDEALPEVADAGAQDDRSIPTAPHPARVCLYRLEDDEKVFAGRFEASGELRGPAISNLESKIAQQRQANSCALALSVREAMGVGAGVEVPPQGGEGAGGAAPSEIRDGESAAGGEAGGDTEPTSTGHVPPSSEP